MDKLSIVIPSRSEIFLEKTTRDVLKNATEDIELFVVLDGYELPANEVVDDPRVTYVKMPKVHYTQKRQGVNTAIGMSTGKYVMSLDAHCMVAPGFDAILKKDMQEDWVMVPRRHRLDAEKWCLQTQVDKRPPIDYEYLMYPGKFTPKAFHGFKWDERTLARQDIMIDDIITMQGSIWIMTRNHFDKHGFMQVEGYTGWGQEAEEISFTTWLTGGRVAINKNTWYAHLHKGPKYGRMYYMSRDENRKSYKYAYDFWMNNRLKNRVHDFDWLIEKFWPLPGWPDNWKEELNYNAG